MSMAINKKYTLPELKEGMKIASKEQLDNIYDTWIILVRKPEEEEYTIGFIGKETNSRSDSLYSPENIICPVFHDSIDAEGDIYYEE